MQVDLVGGQTATSPTTTDKSAPISTLFLLKIDDHTSYKWAWPIHTKKIVPIQNHHFLEHLKTKFNKTLVRIHTDSGTKFPNSTLHEALIIRGVEWHESSSHVPEHNGIVERNLRTIIEKMRALHLQSSLPLRVWPIILTVAINILNMTSNTISPISPHHAVFNE